MNTAEQTTFLTTVRFFPAEREVFRKKEDLTVSQWAEAKRWVTMGAHVGPWRNEISPHLAFIMDTFDLPHVREGVICGSPQTGKTEAPYNLLGKAMAYDPSTMMIIMPSQGKARTVAEDRLIPMIRQSPGLRHLVSDNPDDTAKQRVKLRHGAILYMSWATSADAVAGWPIKYILLDECDKYPPALGKEADPITLAEKRARTFRHTYKIIKVSTPTTEDGPIWQALRRCDVEYHYFARCPSCGEEQTFKLDQLRYDEKAAPEAIRRECSARYECEECGELWTDLLRDRAVRAGRWKRVRGENILRPRAVGFHLPSWISADVSLSEIAAARIKAKTSKTKLIDFYNDYLARPFVESEEGESVDYEVLYNRRRDYAPGGADWQVPMPACVLTAAADIQKNRIEVEVVAWGPGFESWGIEHRVFPGDTSSWKNQVWKDFDAWRKDSRWTHESGVRLRLATVGIDSGYLAPEVYRYVRGKQGSRVYACKGSSTRGKPIVSVSAPKRARRPMKDRYRVNLITIGTEEAKDLLHERLQIEEPGPGYMHYHTGYSLEYFRQLTAEHAVKKYDSRGHTYRVWELKHSDARNEALDLRVINLAMVELLNPKFEVLAENLKKQAAERKRKEAGEDAEKDVKDRRRDKPRRGKGFVHDW